MIGVLSALLCDGFAGEKYFKPTDPLVIKKLEQWSDLKFGFMMHWGAYSVRGISESWTICPEDWCSPKKDPKERILYRREYEKLPQQFNPVNFNPDIIAAAAKDAGMKYLVFTTKHHDGFSMFDTKQTGYRITNTNYPYAGNPKADITREMFKAFRRQGFMIGAYFSKPDWNCPYYWDNDFPVVDRNVNYNPLKYPAKWNAFKKFTAAQIEELMTGYGSIDILWLDGGQVRPVASSKITETRPGRYNQDIDLDSILKEARKHQPGLIAVDRTVVGTNQNYLTPEQKIPPDPISDPWETCMTIAGAWSYVPGDKCKPLRVIIGNLCDIVAKGGCYLLNAGVRPDGELAPEVYERLKEIGVWMKVNGDAIYGTRVIAPYRNGKFAYTQKGAFEYAIYLPDANETELPALLTIPAATIKKGGSLNLLGYHKPLQWTAAEGNITATIPADAVRAMKGAAAWAFRIEKEKAK